jgi:hypothetical protein
MPPDIKPTPVDSGAPSKGAQYAKKEKGWKQTRQRNKRVGIRGGGKTKNPQHHEIRSN